MSQQHINYGAQPNDFTGDSMRILAQKCEENFTELYARYLVTPPITQDDTGIAGQYAFDDSYLYVCTSDNHWRRVPWLSGSW